VPRKTDACDLPERAAPMGSGESEKHVRRFPGAGPSHMRTIFVLCLLASWALGELVAQESARSVGDGRAFTEEKVLTPGQQDRWDVDAKRDEVLRFRVTARQFDPVLELVDAAGVVLASDDGVGSQSYVQYRVRKAGRFGFVVRGFRGGGGGRYDVWLERYQTVAAAVGDVVEGRIGEHGWAHVRLQLEQGERFVPVVDGARLSYVMEFGTDRQLHALLDTYTAPAAGEYHLRVEGGVDDAFALRTLRPTLRSPALDQVVDVKLGPWAVDVLRLQLPAGRAVMFDLVMPGTQLQQHLRPVDARRHYGQLGTAIKGGCVRRLMWSKLGAEVELWLHNASAGEACYRFVPRPADAPAPAAGASATLALGDLSCHTIPVRTGDIVSLVARSGQFDPSMVVIDPNGAGIGHVHDRGPIDRAASLTFDARFDGDYRVLVYSPSHSGAGAYELEVTRHEVPQLTFGKSLRLPCDPTANAHAQLRLPRGQEVWLSVKGEGVDAALTVVDDRGQTLGCWEAGGVGGDVLQALRCERASRLTLFVHSRAGKGTCTVRAMAVE